MKQEKKCGTCYNLCKYGCHHKPYAKLNDESKACENWEPKEVMISGNDVIQVSNGRFLDLSADEARHLEIDEW